MPVWSIYLQGNFSVMTTDIKQTSSSYPPIYPANMSSFGDDNTLDRVLLVDLTEIPLMFGKCPVGYLALTMTSYIKGTTLHNHTTRRCLNASPGRLLTKGKIWLLLPYIIYSQTVSFLSDFICECINAFIQIIKIVEPHYISIRARCSF